MLIAIVVGIPLGVTAPGRAASPDWTKAGRPPRHPRLLPRSSGWAFVLQLVFATQLDWLPVAGRFDRSCGRSSRAAR
ncbi:MAG: hypothetical protein U0869_06105 [Chloroflexota bacterium]